MSQAGILHRATRKMGMAWPSQEQGRILQAVFAPPGQALGAFAAWRNKLEIAQPFDHEVMRLLPLLYLRLQSLGVEDPLMGRLKGVYRRAWSDTHQLFYGTAPALAAIRAAGIKTLLLKGAPMVLSHYRNFGARPMADLDIAVPFADAGQAFRVLEQAGWRAAAPLTRDALAFRHAVSFRGPHGHEVDLHWHILFESGCAAADTPFWETAQPLIFRDIPTHGLTPALNLLHTLAHGMRPNAETPIRWIADALTILRDARAVIDWPSLGQTARRLGLAHRVRLALDYLQDCHGEAVPPAGDEALRRAPRCLAERLELAVMIRHRWPRPAIIDRSLLISAEFCHLARHQAPWAALRMLPEFARYRLGFAAWPNPVRRARRRLQRGFG